MDLLIGLTFSFELVRVYQDLDVEVEHVGSHVRFGFPLMGLRLDGC